MNMIAELRDKIACYVTKNSDVMSWESVRENYGYYSYLTFLCLAAYELDSDCDPGSVCSVIKRYGIEDESVVDFVMGINGADTFITEISGIIKQEETVDINAVYQEYLSQDFILSDGVITFGNGKDNRDILGSYYTQEEFALQITRKAIEDYCSSSSVKRRKIKVADFSCGGGIFLLAVSRICQEKRLPVSIYGYDVDSIAVLITRLRLVQELKSEDYSVTVTLGNPLIHKSEKTDAIRLFKLAVSGRFYHSDIGISPEDNIDIIVGNPPWEKIRFEEKKFLHHYISDAEIKTKAERKQQLTTISIKNQNYFNSMISDYELAKREIKDNPFFKYSNCGELNTYALFTELSMNLLSDRGVASLIIKSSLVKMPVYSSLFRKITQEKNLYELYMFVNRKKIFSIDSREEFAVIYLRNGNDSNLKLAMNLEDYMEFTSQEKIELSYNLLNVLNPDTGMITNIKNNEELKFLTCIYKKHPTFGEEYPYCKFGRLVHLTNHSANIKKQEEEDYIPIYEGKFIEVYTGKYATFRNVSENEKYKNKAAARPIENINGEEYPEARFFIKNDVWESMSKNFNGDFIVAWRSLTAATNRRTMLATALPLIPTCQSVQFLQMPEECDMIHVLSLFNSIVFDYIVRLKMAGLDLTQTIIKQIPVPRKELFYRELNFQGIYASIDSHINSRIYTLYQSDIRLRNLFKKVEKYKIEKSRKELIADLDRLIAILYGIDKKELKQIAYSFDKYYTKEEVETWF